jgi:hypothetical protein
MEWKRDRTQSHTFLHTEKRQEKKTSSYKLGRVGCPGEDAQLLFADGGCDQRAIGGLVLAPAPAHQTECAGETSLDPVSLSHSDTTRMCRGCLCDADVGWASASHVTLHGDA